MSGQQRHPRDEEGGGRDAPFRAVIGGDGDADKGEGTPAPSSKAAASAAEGGGGIALSENAVNRVPLLPRDGDCALSSSGGLAGRANDRGTAATASVDGNDDEPKGNHKREAAGSAVVSDPPPPQQQPPPHGNRDQEVGASSNDNHQQKKKPRFDGNGDGNRQPTVVAAQEPPPAAALAARRIDGAEALASPAAPSPPAPNRRDDAERTSGDDNNTNSSIVDHAVRHYNLKAGDRIEALWTIGDDGDSDDEEDEDNEGIGDAGIATGIRGAASTSSPPSSSSLPVGASYSRWWGATVQPWDGSHRDGMAIRTLLYDAYPPGGFPDPSLESVVFAEPIGNGTARKECLLTYPGLEPLVFRREEEEAAAGSSGEDGGAEHVVVVSGPEGLEQIVDAVLSNALRKNSAQWSQLTAAGRARVADVVARRRARLLELLEEHMRSHDCLSSSDVQAILARTTETP